MIISLEGPYFTAVASISISHSGKARRVTPSKVLARALRGFVERREAGPSISAA